MFLMTRNHDDDDNLMMMIAAFFILWLLLIHAIGNAHTTIDIALPLYRSGIIRHWIKEHFFSVFYC